MTSAVAEHQHGLWDGHRGHGLHVHRSPPPFRYSQHPGLGPQQRFHHSLQAYPSLCHVHLHKHMMNSKMPSCFLISFSSFEFLLNASSVEILELKTLKGLALHDILTEVHLLIHRGKLTSLEHTVAQLVQPVCLWETTVILTFAFTYRRAPFMSKLSC